MHYDGKVCKSEDVEKLEQLNAEMLEMLKIQDNMICEFCKRLNPQHENCIDCPGRDQTKSIIEKVEQ
jgi:hypothetical protein